jgi:hypothetical protein
MSRYESWVDLLHDELEIWNRMCLDQILLTLRVLVHCEYVVGFSLFTNGQPEVVKVGKMLLKLLSTEVLKVDWDAGDSISSDISRRK